jgi:curli biogenesis system outer membrane secretion channel CsgG
MTKDIGHQVASEAAKMIVTRLQDAGLSWQELCISCESAIAIVVATAVTMSGSDMPERMAAELIDSMTEAAQNRVVTALQQTRRDG